MSGMGNLSGLFREHLCGHEVGLKRAAVWFCGTKFTAKIWDLLATCAPDPGPSSLNHAHPPTASTPNLLTPPHACTDLGLGRISN